MARKRVPPEAQIIALFTGLSEENQRMVMFGLNAIMAQSVPKSTAPTVQSAGRKSSRKGTETGHVVNTEVGTANASVVGASGD